MWRTDNKNGSDWNQRRVTTWIPVPLLLIGLGIVSQYSGLDMWIARHFFNALTATWLYKEHWLASTVIHKGGRDLVVVADAIMLIAMGASLFIKRLTSYRKALIYLCIVSLSSPAVVAILKSVTHIYAPWDLSLFGGIRPHIRLFDAVPPGAPVGHAFPAGHASGAFAFFSLFFLLSRIKPSIRYLGLIPPVVIGGCFGVAQQMRGAHFLSHDLFSAAVCWACAMGSYYLMYKSESLDHVDSLSRGTS